MGDPDFLDKLAAVKGALIIAGLVYVLFAGLIKIFGYEKVNKLLPPIVGKKIRRISWTSWRP